MRTYLLGFGVTFLHAGLAAAQLGSSPPAARQAPPTPRAEFRVQEGSNQLKPVEAGPPAPSAMFAAIDTDGDGTITKNELRKAIKSLMTLDTDKDGSITLEEASAGEAPAPLANRPNLPGPPNGDPEIVRVMANDLNGDGKLTPNELPNDLRLMLQNADQNGDGAIDRRELAAARANMPNQFRGAQGAFRPGAGGIDRNSERAMGQFLQMDSDGNGRLTPNELSPDATRMLQGADQNGDGSVDAGELQAVIARMGDRARAVGSGFEPGGAQSRPFQDPNRRNRPRPGNSN
jgi:Ca2+-binding EF-hand superfamily protein